MVRLMGIAWIALCVMVVPMNTSIAGGKHYGQLKMLEADIEFLNPQGTAVIDGSGITYLYRDRVYRDNRIIYPSIYWGEYPLYLAGNVVTKKVTITNAGPRSIAKHTLVTEAFYINPDGSTGEALSSPSQQYIEVSLGETRVIDASFTLPANAKPGLDLFRVHLYYKNSTNDALLVMKLDGVFSPREYLDGLETYVRVVPINSSIAGGKHYGQLKMLEANIWFSGAVGSTVADGSGLTYRFNGMQIGPMPPIYAPEYYGTYPLYWPGQTAAITVTITNTGPRSIAKHTLVTEAFVLNPDCSPGPALTAPQTRYIEVSLGETRVIDASFVLPVVFPKPLNVFRVSLLHHYNSTNDASLVLRKDGIFCPPEHIDGLETY